MKFEQIMQDIENKTFHPTYLLAGEEAYYIDEITDALEKNVLTDTEKEFNQTVVYGKDINASTLVSYCRRLPMMAEYQVVILKEGQDMRDFDQLADYMAKPVPSTIFVACYKHKKIDKRKNLARTASKNGVFFESAKIYDNKVPAWITTYLKEKKYTIQPQTTALLADHLGTDLNKIVNELKKLIINIPARTEITVDIVERNIGISKDFNVFELQKALGTKNILKANQIIHYFGANPKANPLVKTLPVLYNFFSKTLIYHTLKDKSQNSVAATLGINPYFVRDYEVASRNYGKRKLMNIMGYLREYDLKSKGVNNATVSDGELFKELTYKILH